MGIVDIIKLSPLFAKKSTSGIILGMCYVLCMVISMHRGSGGFMEERPSHPYLGIWGQSPRPKFCGLFLVHFWPILCFSINGFWAHCNLISVKGIGL